MQEREDKQRVTLALAGDPGARRALVTRLLPTIEARVLHVLLRYKRHEQACQAAPDLAQQVFVRLFEDGGRRLRAWEPGRGAALLTFVGLIAEREVVSILRRDRQNPWTEAPTDGDELADRAGAGPDLEGPLASRDLLNVVLDRALARLDERGLLLFQRLIVDEAELATVARETGTTLAALYMWKSRFAKLTREIADELGGEPPSPMRRPSSIGLQPAWKMR